MIDLPTGAAATATPHANEKQCGVLEETPAMVDEQHPNNYESDTEEHANKYESNTEEPDTEHEEQHPNNYESDTEDEEQHPNKYESDTEDEEQHERIMNPTLKNNTERNMNPTLKMNNNNNTQTNINHCLSHHPPSHQPPHGSNLSGCLLTLPLLLGVLGGVAQ